MPITPHLEIPAELRQAEKPANPAARQLAEAASVLSQHPSPSQPSLRPPTLKANNGWSGSGQAFYVAGFTRKLCALGHSWGQKTLVSPLSSNSH